MEAKTFNYYLQTVEPFIKWIGFKSYFKSPVIDPEQEIRIYLWKAFPQYQGYLDYIVREKGEKFNPDLETFIFRRWFWQQAKRCLWTLRQKEKGELVEVEGFNVRIIQAIDYELPDKITKDLPPLSLLFFELSLTMARKEIGKKERKIIYLWIKGYSFPEIAEKINLEGSSQRASLLTKQKVLKIFDKTLLKLSGPDSDFSKEYKIRTKKKKERDRTYSKKYRTEHPEQKRESDRKYRLKIAQVVD